MYIRPEREEQVDFVPYVSVGNEIVVQAKNPKGITGREDMCGAKIAVTLGGFQEKLAREDDENCKKAGKAGVNVMTLPDRPGCGAGAQERPGRCDLQFDARCLQAGAGTAQRLQDRRQDLRPVRDGRHRGAQGRRRT